ncbi:MAG: hypothetical protein GTO53_07190 [Planctomycetales bacterium]|nr:hypothetical protein [Planctomycetales bacterium]NIM08921.1 hypothetical protein [Planctomycetales bacterium]NIN08391.1 hypothetical protein [Planctomycetales bacterium]NIN77519.1 hypothetical protein [Planctomycetales bacterium]NIO34691.1 hypothetical protein [Planctomycetales bacterium]
MAEEKEQNGQEGAVQKQKASVYTMMLICSFLALVLACLLMYLELRRYDFDMEAEKYKSSSAAQIVANSPFLG